MGDLCILAPDMKILVVEDEPTLARHVKRALVQAGHEVDTSSDGPSAVTAAGAAHYDLVVLDINLPGFDGLEVLRRLGGSATRPRVLLLTARADIEDRVAGLKAGADDYLTKPFALEEMLARVEALGRRGAIPKEQNELLVVGDLKLDLVKRRVTRGGEKIELSPREFEVLQVFLKEPDRVFTRDEICERIWEREHEYDTRTVEIFIMRLRKKLDPGTSGSVIETVRGVGYVLRTPK